MKTPIVSLIVAAYNEELYISKLIDSIKKQSYKNWELIIVDDNSKDKTYSILKDYEENNKKIKVLRQKKGTRGPGNAWNLAVSRSKGTILFFIGADTILGKDYIKNMIDPILNKKAIGTLHQEEKVANKCNLWARAFGPRRCVDKNNKGVIFGAILTKYFDKVGGFDPSLGYGDDRTLYNKLKINSLGVDAEIYHHNPQSFSENWKHHKWVGASLNNPWKAIIIFPLFPLWVLYKSAKDISKDPCLNFIWFLPIYNTIKYFGYLNGAVKKVITKKIY